MAGMTEADLIPILCSLMLSGTPEARVEYSIAEGTHHIRVDCLTETHGIEIGLDGRRSSLDSVQQALFAAALTGRAPMVVLIDTDGAEDAVEYRVETAARAAGVTYRVVDVDFLVRLQMTAHFRAMRERLLSDAGS
jgi:hypothetical protein